MLYVQRILHINACNFITGSIWKKETTTHLDRRMAAKSQEIWIGCILKNIVYDDMIRDATGTIQNFLNFTVATLTRW